ncbi:MAG: PTS sugar transporter subunit IIC [Saccharofermentans sp.]|nr:PTS sugar transporter subunit IIC [Saccharofermentans sp.]
MTKKKEQKKETSKVKSILNLVFIDGLSGMATGLFCTLIIGTIVGTIGGYIPGALGIYITLIGKMAQCLMGAGIGLGVAVKFKEKPLVLISAAVCGMIGAYAKVFTLDMALMQERSVLLPSPGEPLGAFVAAIIGIAIGHLVAGKTKVDIIVTPLCTIVAGATAGILFGPYVSKFMTWLGGMVNWGTEQQPLLMGILVSVLMGIFLTLPISSAAIGVALGLSGITAGAATIGCCCNMIGFAVISYRENKVDGLLAQGLGTSMLQVPNIVKNPKIWIPSIISSAILGPISTMVFGMTSNAVGSGMGTSGLVGPISTFTTMIETTSPAVVIGEIVLMYFILPAAISLGISEFMRKKGWIKFGDLKINI